MDAGPGRHVPRWPLLLLCLPAFVAVWAGWVGLGKMTGFGVVRPLPGIADSFEIDTAITLPIGVETYAAYALWVWLSGRGGAAAKAFAKWSAIVSLTLGAAGQVAYHLLVPQTDTAAPWWITTLVSCLPVAVLGMGSALAHMASDHQPAPESAPAPPEPVRVEGVPRTLPTICGRDWPRTLTVPPRTPRTPTPAHPAARIEVPTIVLPRTGTGWPAHPLAQPVAHPVARTNGHPVARANGAPARTPRARDLRPTTTKPRTPSRTTVAHPRTPDDLPQRVRDYKAAHPDASARAIARELGCSDSTVRTHLKEMP